VAEPRVQKAAAAAAAAGAAVVVGTIAHHKLAARAEPRAYRLLEGEPVPDGLARAARGRIVHALEGLRGGRKPDKAVHEARKDTKKVRAVLRLAWPQLGEKTYRRENARFRELARGLGGVRDARAMLEALDGLVEHGLDRRTAARLRRGIESHERELAEQGGAPTGELIEELESAREEVESWPLGSDGWKGIEPGLRRVYRNGRRRMREAESDPSTEALHEWRKRTKDLRYHLSLLKEAWPAVMKAEADEARALSDHLGDDHDLALLWEFALDRDLDSRRLYAAVERRRGELQKSAFGLGRRLYAERPREFTGRIGSLWAAWRSSGTDL
jgi:CHAD domain-containing protein